MHAAACLLSTVYCTCNTLIIVKAGWLRNSAKMALVAYDSSGSSDEESGGEESIKSFQARERDQKSILAVVAPSIGSGKKGKGKVVKIGLPTLVQQVRGL